jgi:hypothetical protein
MSATAIVEDTVRPELEQKALTLPQQAKQITIGDQQTYDHAIEFLKGVAAMRKQIVDHHAPLKKKAHEAHKAICDAETELLKPVTEAEQTAKRAIATWDAEQRRLAAETERKQREELERIAAEEIEAAAVEAEAQGASASEVAAIIEQPLIVPEIRIEPTFQRASGVATTTTWRAEVVNMRELCRAIADGKLSTEYVLPNTTALNARARAEKQTLSIPGVRAVPMNNVRVGGR